MNRAAELLDVLQRCLTFATTGPPERWAAVVRGGRAALDELRQLLASRQWPRVVRGGLPPGPHFLQLDDRALTGLLADIQDAHVELAEQLRVTEARLRDCQAQLQATRSRAAEADQAERGEPVSPVPDPAERHHLPMVCTCGPEREAAGEALYQRVKAGLSRGSDELKAREITDRTFVDDLLLSLLADHGATVESIHGDQWFAVTVESFTAANEELHVVCQRDQPTLGLAAIWEWYEQRKAQP